MSIKSSGMLPKEFENTKFTKLGKELLKYIDREVDSYCQRYKTAVAKSINRLHKQAVMDWYSASGLHTGAEVARAVRTEGSFITGLKNKKTIHVDSYFDNNALDAMSEYYESALKWAARHQELCTMSVGKYIFTLRWDLGITALPEKAHFTGSGWVNENFEFSSLGTMKDYCVEYITSNLGSTIPSLMRGRNRSMGAGTLSKNRGGLSNLTHGK